MPTSVGGASPSPHKAHQHDCAPHAAPSTPLSLLACRAMHTPACLSAAAQAPPLTSTPPGTTHARLPPAEVPLERPLTEEQAVADLEEIRGM